MRPANLDVHRSHPVALKTSKGDLDITPLITKLYVLLSKTCWPNKKFMNSTVHE
jgi:hypothetical protein